MNNENFQEYMDYFKNLSLKEKQKIIYDQLKLLSGFTNNLCETAGIKNELITNGILVLFGLNRYVYLFSFP